LRLEHFTLTAPTVFQILALEFALINMTKFCLENQLSPEIHRGRKLLRGRMNFWALIAYISQTVRYSDKVTNRKSYTPFQMVPNLLTSGDKVP